MKPAELYIPHHIDTTNLSADVFLLTAEDNEFEKSNYLGFIQNSNFRFSLDSTVVQITSPHFCSNCIATYGRQYREVPKRYLIARADKKQSDGTLVVEFIFIYQERSCIKVHNICSYPYHSSCFYTQMIEGQCVKNEFKITKYIPVKFIGDKRVSITFESVSGWKINCSGYDYVSIVD